MELNCQICGEGEPLILLHGNGEDHTYFEHQISYFSKNRRVLALDTRGHGASPRGVAPFTIRQFAEDLYVFMQQQKITSADLLGFSDGGNIALTFALQHPQCVRRLILNGANLYPAGVKWRYQFPIVLGYGVASVLAAVSEQAKKKAALLALMVKEPQIEPCQLASPQVPTLVLAGTDDMIKDVHTRLIADSLPNARLELLEGDHFIARKHPDVFNARVEAFLCSVPG